MWASSYPCLGAGHLTDDPPSLAVAPSFSISKGFELARPQRKKNGKENPSRNVGPGKFVWGNV